MHPILNIAVNAARRAGDIVIRAAGRPDKLKIREKNKNDFVTEIDQLAEQDIISTIHRAYPKHGILAEESGKTSGKDYVWIIDPIDGTHNFIHGFPHFCISIAVEYRGQLEHAVIYDPVRNELFTASRGKGAKLNDYKIRVSPRKNLKECLIGTSSPHKNPALQTYYLKTYATIMPKCLGLRKSGSAALDLAYVAAGRLDAHLGLDLKMWDIAAGVLLIKEAGGILLDINGKENKLEDGNIISANPKIVKDLYKIISEIK